MSFSCHSFKQKYLARISLLLLYSSHMYYLILFIYIFCPPATAQQDPSADEKYFIESNGTNVYFHINSKTKEGNDSLYYIDYFPSYGSPPPNTTVDGSYMKVADLLPGTRYQFRVFLSNPTGKNQLVYNSSIVTDPDPPSHPFVQANNDSAHITFSPPEGGWTSFKLQVDDFEKNNKTNITLSNFEPFILHHLRPGGTYCIRMFTLNGQKESHFKELNFTTRPNPPAKLIVWKRTERTLKVLTSAPSLPSIYSQFKITIEPETDTVIYIEKDDPHKAEQEVFRDLVPGKHYTVSAQTISNGVLSSKISRQCQTLPLPPIRLQVNPASVTTHSFSVTWDPPEDYTEFDKYQISINLLRENPVSPTIKNKTESRSVNFNEGLLPGHTYHVQVTTVSGKASSKPLSVNATVRPLPVNFLRARVEKNYQAKVDWAPNKLSFQNSYEISYSEVENGTVLNGDTNSIITFNTMLMLESLLPGRNYSISIKSLSNNLSSSPVVTFLATRPSIPDIESMKPIEYGLNISWRSEVDSQQDNYEIYCFRNSSGKKGKHFVTKNTHYLITNLYPGALYHIQIFAVSHGLRSQPHDSYQVVFPKPPLSVKTSTSRNSIMLNWRRPSDTLFSKYSVRFKTEGQSKWNNDSVEVPRYEIKDLTPGERYLIQINTVSHDMESARPLNINHTVYPNSPTDIISYVDSTNITFEFPKPNGRSEFYIVHWTSLDDKEKDYQRSKKLNGTLTKDNQVQLIIDKLMPGIKYKFSVGTVSYGLQSLFTNFSAQTKPIMSSQLTIIISESERTALTIQYSPSIGHFDKYNFKLSNYSIIKDRFDNERNVTFLDLIPGKLYNITAWTISGAALSKPVFNQERLFPDPISNINAVNITDCSITLHWDRPNCEVNSYEVKLFSSKGLVFENITKDETFTASQLKPYTNYTFKVIVRAGEESSLLRKSFPFSAIYQTKEGLPGMVQEFQTIDIHPREVSFDWKLPSSEMNGNLTRFTITCTREGSSDVRIIDLNPLVRRCSIKDLLPGEKYIFRIKAATKVGYGPESSAEERMPTLAPPKPSSEATPTEISHSSTTIRIRFQKDYFSNENGQVQAYTIIVAEDHKKNISTGEMPSWSDVQTFAAWPPYQVLEPYYPFNNSEVEEFVIGEDESCRNKKGGYCNGPLKEGAVYRVKIRAFTTEKDFTDTDYSVPIQTDQNRMSLLIVFLLPAVFILVLVFGNIILRRCKNQPVIHETLHYTNIEIGNESITSKPIKVDGFRDYYEKMSADNNLKFSEEFEKLQHIGRDQSCMYANALSNKSKNRFSNIVPYDHSRFKLQPLADGFDYINANYVPGYNSMTEYIATQGPLPTTKIDFWRMCWESNSRAIVMLTRCVEEGREKCDRYWPEDTETIYYGNICVKIINQQFHPDWCITELDVRKGSIERIIRHFHFTSWPVFGVPNPVTTLVNFVMKFRQKVLNEPRPIVVHCSAGVGRSGTFIVVDHILQALAHGEEFLDIYGIVYELRKARVLMVQTEKQYIAIHKCALAILQQSNRGLEEQETIYQNMAFEDDEGIAETGI